MARGLVGTRGDASTVASPIYKQVFNLATGQCLDDETVSLRSWPVRIVDGMVEVDG
jgi:nitrite reductase (NADH) small subunit